MGYYALEQDLDLAIDLDNWRDLRKGIINKGLLPLLVAERGFSTYNQSDFLYDKRYLRRNEKLRAMGFHNYQEYLKSDLWKSIKKKVLCRDQKRCVMCRKNKAWCVHHINYHLDTLKGNNLRPLVSLCKECHCKIEFDSYGQKRSSLDKVNIELINHLAEHKKNKIFLKQAEVGPNVHLPKNMVFKKPKKRKKKKRGCLYLSPKSRLR